MKKALVAVALLIVTVIQALTPCALAEPSDTLQSVYDALVAEDSGFSLSRASYAEYYEGVTLEALLEDDGIRIVLNSENEYVESGSWFFAEEGDRLTVTLAAEDYYGLSMAQMLMDAAVTAQGVNPALYNGNISALTLTGRENPYFSYEEDETSGEIKLSLNITGPYEMKGLDGMVVTEELLIAEGYEPMGDDYMGRAINFGKISMVINGNADGATFLVMEYGELDDLAYQAITCAVKTLQPKGWEDFLATFTELKDAKGDSFSAAMNVDAAEAREIIEDLPKEYSFAIIRFGQSVVMDEAEDEAETEYNPDMLAGGWENVPCEAILLPEDSQAAFDDAVSSIEDATYTPVALLSTQLVAGTNYCILCQISNGEQSPEPVWALVYIHADLQGNAEILNVYELYIERHIQPTE